MEVPVPDQVPPLHPQQRHQQHQFQQQQGGGDKKRPNYFTFLMRKNTVCLEMNIIVKETTEKPSCYDIEEFIEKQLLLGVNEIEDFCIHGLIKNVYIKLRS